MKNKTFVLKLVSAFFLFIIFGNLSAQEKVTIIVNKDLPISSISETKIQKVYFGKTTLWDNKVKINPCLLNFKTEFGKELFRMIVNESPRKYQRHWLKQLFSGYGAAPITFGSSIEIIEYVSKNSGAIGFIYTKDAKSLKNCKVIRFRF